MAANRVPLNERLWARSYHDKDTDCFLWTGSLTNNGYGKLSMRVGLKGRRTSTTHREAYKFFVGDIPDGLLVLHTCDTGSCWNPEHLYLGNTSDNQRDRFRRSKRFNRDTINGRFCGS